ncbi:hypothetical protein AVEN_259779-1, partial [Araneus ventricosus]
MRAVLTSFMQETAIRDSDAEVVEWTNFSLDVRRHLNLTFPQRWICRGG